AVPKQRIAAGRTVAARRGRLVGPRRFVPASCTSPGDEFDREFCCGAAKRHSTPLGRWVNRNLLRCRNGVALVGENSRLTRRCRRVDAGIAADRRDSSSRSPIPAPCQDALSAIRQVPAAPESVERAPALRPGVLDRWGWQGFAWKVFHSGSWWPSAGAGNAASAD